MLDSKSYKLTRLSRVDDAESQAALGGLLLAGEEVVLALTDFDGDVAFTTRRILICIATGMTGKKRDFTSIPFADISAFSTETTESKDTVSEICVSTGSFGVLTFALRTPIPIAQFNELVGGRLL